MTAPTLRYRLDEADLRDVRTLVATAAEGRSLRRALAVLWLGEGESPARVARRLCVSRASVYNWAARFRSRAELPPAERVADAARSGRPPSRS